MYTVYAVHIYSTGLDVH